MAPLLYEAVLLGIILAVHGNAGSQGCSRRDLCRDPTSCPLEDLHYEVPEIITTIESALGLAGTCEPIRPNQLEYWLYTRTNNATPIISNGVDPLPLDSTKPLVVLIPGWFSTGDSPGYPEMTAAYLQRYDCNVLVLNWYNITLKAYKVVVCEIPLVARIVAARLCSLNVAFSKIHIIGQSFGAQLAGWIGQETQRICGRTVDRITGLDAAGPVYQQLPASQRLSPTDASFVDAIHTNEGFANYYGNLGTVDFHVNCGTHQPGCPALSVGSLTNAAVALGQAKGAAACDGSDFNQAFAEYGNIGKHDLRLGDYVKTFVFDYQLFAVTFVVYFLWSKVSIPGTSWQRVARAALANADPMNGLRLTLLWEKTAPEAHRGATGYLLIERLRMLLADHQAQSYAHKAY